MPCQNLLNLKSEAFHYPVASPEKTLATGFLLRFPPSSRTIVHNIFHQKHLSARHRPARAKQTKIIPLPSNNRQSKISRKKYPCARQNCGGSVGHRFEGGSLKAVGMARNGTAPRPDMSLSCRSPKCPKLSGRPSNTGNADFHPKAAKNRNSLNLLPNCASSYARTKNGLKPGTDTAGPDTSLPDRRSRRPGRPYQAI